MGYMFLEKEGSLLPDRMISVAALWPTCLGRSAEEVKLLLRKNVSSTMQEQKDASSSPSQKLSQHIQTQFSILLYYCNKCIRKPNTSLLKKIFL